MLQLTGEAINALHRMSGGLPSSPLLFDLHGGSPSATWLLVDKNILRRKDALGGLGLPHHLLADQETRYQKLRVHSATGYAALIAQRAPALFCGKKLALVHSLKLAEDCSAWLLHMLVRAQGSAEHVSKRLRPCAPLPDTTSASAVPAPCSHCDCWVLSPGCKLQVIGRLLFCSPSPDKMIARATKE